MRTTIAPSSLADPDIAEAELIIKQCIHCGCCNSRCPTFDLLGDERDSPRGRIYLMKEMLENGRAPDEEIVTHIDRCLSCNGCLTSCPSNVDYMHLVDHARSHIEDNYRRPWSDRLRRRVLAAVLPYPDRFRRAIAVARPFRGLAGMLETIGPLKSYGAMLRQVPVAPPATEPRLAVGTHATTLERTQRVIIPSGCVQPVLDPEINRSAIRVLNLVGVDVVISDDDNCCGALVHHLGRKEQALGQARRNIDAWHPRIASGEIDAIVITASGCGTTIKDYGHMFKHDPAYAEKAAQVAKATQDVTEFLAAMELPKPDKKLALKVAYQSACSLQHGQKITNQPRKLLLRAGFKITRPDDEYMCCGSAGTYSILQPELSRQLRDTKVAKLEATGADLIASGNIGCLTHLAAVSTIPTVHTVVLLDWAWTGRKPPSLADFPG